MKLIRTFLKDQSRSLANWFVGKWSNFNYAMAKGDALRRCEQEGRKVYVIQSSPVNWLVFTTAEIRHLKKTRVFKKTLTWKEMTEKAAFVAYPKKMYN